MAVNNITLAGRLATDPESRESKSGTQMCRARLAVNQGKDKDAMFVTIQAYGQTAGFLQEYGSKGAPITVSGRLAIDIGQGEHEGKTFVMVHLNDLELPKVSSNEETTF